jgi:hypothetical protein
VPQPTALPRTSENRVTYRKGTVVHYKDDCDKKITEEGAEEDEEEK